MLGEQCLLRIKFTIAPSFVITPPMTKFKPRNKSGKCCDKQYRQKTRTYQRPLHLESFLLTLP